MRVTATVTQILEGHCRVHREGDSLVFVKSKGTTNRLTALDTRESCPRVCVHALSGLFPYVFAEKTWDPANPVDYYRCPDPGPDHSGRGSVLFRVERHPDSSSHGEREGIVDTGEV
jgi:uncharacterized repeat protein (TIGR04076 family)